MYPPHLTYYLAVYSEIKECPNIFQSNIRLQQNPGNLGRFLANLKGIEPIDWRALFIPPHT